MKTTAPGPQLAIIADDDNVGRLLLEQSVGAVGLEYRSFDNGQQAWAAATLSVPSIILLDVHMPALDGLEVCRRLRGDRRFTDVPIVIVTGVDDSGAIREAFEAGATDFISKPVNWALLPRRLEYILRNAESSRALRDHALQVRTLVDALPDRLWVVDHHGALKWSPQQQLFPLEGADVQMAPETAVPLLHAAVSRTAADGRSRKVDYRSPEGEPAFSCELHVSKREGGDIVVARRDTTEQTLAAERIEKLAYFDPLTGLANRNCYLEKAAGWMAHAPETGESVALLYMDLNDFKRINDSFGHAVGDIVLRTVAERLHEAVERSRVPDAEMLVSRLGGDEFVIAIRDTVARDLAGTVAAACLQALSEPVWFNNLELYCGPSIGLAVFPDDGPDLTTVMKCADIAMYRSKSEGADAVVAYDPSMSSKLQDWLALEGRLRRAVREQMLRVEFQPKFSLEDGTVSGAEALLRWNDEEFGEVSPARFIEIAEDSGLILEITGWLVRAVCLQIRAWSDAGVAIPVAINCSAKELMHGNPAAIIAREADNAGISATLIEVEITESLLLSDSSVVRDVLQSLRALGCHIALDDFGTRYSSLAYITRFPPDRIKIDRAFVTNVAQSPADAAVASAILSLASSLGLDVTAEGIENAEQLEWLRSNGCHEGQGYLLSRPITAAEFTRRYVQDAASTPGSHRAA